MAQYRVTGQMYFRAGKKFHVGDVVTLPDAEKPAPGWTPIDAAAKAMVESIAAAKSPGKVVPTKAKATPPPAPPADPVKPGQRPSDKAPV